MSSKSGDKSPTSTMKKPPKIKQACDCCHARKIRCDGASVCFFLQACNDLNYRTVQKSLDLQASSELEWLGS
jgi:hypothetical protein